MTTLGKVSIETRGSKAPPQNESLSAQRYPQ
jgi:hypothetical protein